MKNKILTIVLLALVFASCTHDKSEVIDEPVQPNQADTNGIGKRVVQAEPKATDTAPTINYAGKYELKVVRFKEFTIHHKIELSQTQDSVKGFYDITYTNRKGKLIANYKGAVRGEMMQTVDNVNSGTDLWITLTDQKVDSVNYKASHEASYMIDKFLSGLLLTTRMSQKENTFENNYAGGEWDTWKRMN